jgi:predicted esterase
VKTWYWLACFHSLLGRPAQAISELESGLAEGCWWGTGLLDGDSDLTAARGLPGFAGIRRECEARCERARASSRPGCLVLSPASAQWDPRTLVFLHRYGDTARDFAEIWRPLVDEGWTLVVPQSSQPADSECFCWNDRELALREVRQHLEDCRLKRGLAPEGMVIAGASQGAHVAVDVAFGAGLPWLCVIPSFPQDWRPEPGPGVHAPPGAVIVGETDPANARIRAVVSSFQSAGLRVSLGTMQAVGHDLPREAVRVAAEALRELAGDAAGGEPLAGDG